MSEREAARELIRELLAEALASPNGNGNGNGHGDAPAVYPPPPVAAVHRPSTWAAPSAEPVTLRTDEDLDRFVLALLARFEDPRQRDAIRSGRVRFTLGAAGAAAGGAAGGSPGRNARAAAGGSPERNARAAAGPPPAPGGAIHVPRGAVTERKVEEAARAGARLVLGPAAVLTPLAREKARAKGIAIERER